VCTTVAPLDCSGMAATDHSSCVAAFDDNYNSFPLCASEFKTWAACLATKPVSDFMCASGTVFSKDDVCSAEAAAIGVCASQ
jgi:hypothetical protein